MVLVGSGKERWNLLLAIEISLALSTIMPQINIMVCQSESYPIYLNPKTVLPNEIYSPSPLYTVISKSLSTRVWLLTPTALTNFLPGAVVELAE